MWEKIESNWVYVFCIKMNDDDDELLRDAEACNLKA